MAEKSFCLFLPLARKFLSRRNREREEQGGRDRERKTEKEGLRRMETERKEDRDVRRRKAEELRS